jgi:hypothetical protein
MERMRELHAVSSKEIDGSYIENEILELTVMLLMQLSNICSVSNNKCNSRLRKIRVSAQNFQLKGRYTRKNPHKLSQTYSRLVAMLFQQLVNRMCSHCLFPACWQVVNGLLTTYYKVVELNRLVTSCWNNLLSYRPAIQQFVNKLWVTTL